MSSIPFRICFSPSTITCTSKATAGPTSQPTESTAIFQMACNRFSCDKRLAPEETISTNSANPADPLPETHKTNTSPGKSNPLHWPHPGCHSSPNAHLPSYDSHARPRQIPRPPPDHTASNALPKAYDNFR